MQGLFEAHPVTVSQCERPNGVKEHDQSVRALTCCGCIGLYARSFESLLH